jgi:hypothetical protein
MIRIVRAVAILIVAITTNTPAGSKTLNCDHWLIGEFTQNVPCKGDGTDPTELKTRISTDQIESKAGVCRFLDTQSENNRLRAHALCHYLPGR